VTFGSLRLPRPLRSARRRATSVRRGIRHHPLVRGALLTAAGVVLVSLAVAAVQLAQARRELTSARSELVAAKDALAHQDDDAARARLDVAAERLERARDKATAWPLHATRVVPLVGSPARAAATASRAGLEVVAAGRAGVAAVAAFPSSGVAGLEGHDLSAFHAAAAAADTHVAEARVHLDRAAELLEGPAGAVLGPVHGPARTLAAIVDDQRTTLDRGHRALQLLGDLTASGSDTRLLLAAQDTQELRPTGGYIGSYGILHVHDGVVELESYESFEDLPAADPPLAPPPGLDLILTNPWGLENGNWWPDFPTSAANLRDLLQRQGGPDVDGVVAITEDLLGELVGVFEPVQLPSYSEPVVAEGFEQRALHEVELKRPLDTPRKKFIIELAHEVVDRILSLQAGQVPEVARIMDAAVGRGDLQVWFADAARQSQLDGTMIAGALPRVGDGDFLSVVEFNTSASKANAQLLRTINYSVSPGDDGALVASLTIHYVNRGAATAINPYYAADVRIYVPSGAQLVPGEDPPLDADGAPLGIGTVDVHAIPRGPAVDGPYDVFGAGVVVEPNGGEATVRVRYLLPPRVTDHGRYRLTWYRQPGTPADVLSGTVLGTSFTTNAAQRYFTISRPT
jgi:hypothetical protein